MQSFEIRQVDVCEIYELRRKILRPNADIEAAHFDGDDARFTLHVGFFIQDRLVGCASLMRTNNVGFTDNRQYQLRGMAIDTPYQRQGYGAALIKYAEFLCLNRDVTLLWCNARVDASGFYANNGFTAYGEEFYIPDVCNHVLMAKKVVEHTCKECQCQ